LLQKTLLFLEILSRRFMSPYKIFISSPGDVGRERHLAEQVIRRVATEFQNRVEIQPYFWEYEPMESTRDYQENIPLTSAFDLVICILWKRLGSPLSVKHQRPEGGQWRSGTEFELVTAVESKKARGAPDVFIFKNDTKPTFEADEAGEGAKTELDFAQWKALIAFIKEWCEGVQDGQRVFTAALNRYQALDQFEQVLEKLLLGKLNERFPPAPDPAGSERDSLRPPAPTWTEGSPFRGLEAFQFLHAAVFCGRTHAIGEVLDRLRRKAAHGRPFVLILGASGSGKSSLAMAGVLPLLVKPGTIEGVGLWRRVVFRPGGQTEVGDLFDRLAAALVRRQQEGEGLPELISGSTTVQQLAADLRADPKAAALLVRSALNQVAVLYREVEAQKLRSWIAESQTENRAADVERYGRLLAELTPREARLALVIDQAEELFTADDLNRRPELRKGFAVALDALAASGLVFVLATLRSDFYSQIQQLPAFVDLKEADGQFDLLPAQPAEIAQMIRQPALAAGLRFEKDPQTRFGLDEVLADQVKAEPRLLPLLEFALDELYKQRSAGGLLSFEAYRVHLDGSIVRALAKRADATLAGLPEPSRDAFRSVMRRLATTVDDTAAGSAKGPQLDVLAKGSIGPAFQRQRVPYDQLTAHPPGAKGLVDAFVAARLLVVETGKTDDQKAEVTVAHEALFQHWDALKNLLLAERDDLILPRARVAASYEHWRAENRSGDFLLPPGKQLSEAEQLLAEYGEELTPELKVYVAASMAHAHAQQRQRQRLLVGALVVFAVLFMVAVVAAIFASKAEQTANEQKAKAEKQTVQAETAARQARAALSGQLAVQARTLLESHPQRGLLLAVEALNATSRMGEKPVPAAEEALRAALASSGGRVAARDDKPIGDVALSSDNKWLVTVTGSGVLLWNLSATDQPARPISLLQDGSGPVAFSPDNHWLATGSLTALGGGLSVDGNVQLWDLTAINAEPKRRPLDGNGPITFSPDNRWLVTADRKNNALLWDLTSPNPATAPIVLSGHTMQVTQLAVSPNGNWLATASNESDTHTGSHDPTARLWDLTRTDPASGPIVLRGHEGPIGAIAFNSDSKRLVTAGGGNSMGLGRMDKTVRLWDLAAKDPSANAIVFSGEDVFDYASIGHDNHWLVTIGSIRDPNRNRSEATARLWDLTAKDPAATKAVLLADGLPVSVAIATFSSDRRWLATAGPENTVRLWDLTAKETIANPRVLRGHEGRINSLAFSPDNLSLVAGGEDGTARLWGLTTAESIANPITVQSDGGFIISPDSHWMATKSTDDDSASASIWDLTAADPAMTPKVFTASKYAFLEFAFSPDSRWLLSGDDKGDARLWDLTAKGAAVNPIVIRGHTSHVSAVAISPDKRWLVTGSFDGTAHLWNLDANGPTGAPRVLQASAKTPDGRNGAIYEVVISRDNHWLITWGEGAFLFDLTALDPGLHPMPLGGIDGPDSVTVSPDSHWLATVSTPRRDPQERKALENKIRSATDDEQRGKLIEELSNFQDTLPPVARLWNLSAEDPAAEPRVLQNASSPVAISPDGHWLITGGPEGTARIWDLTAKDPSAQPRILLGHTKAINNFVFSPDNRWLITGSYDDTARVWDLERLPDYEHSKSKPVILKGEGQPVTAIDVSFDNRWVATGSYGKWFLLWDLAAKEPAGSPIAIALPVTGEIGRATFTRDGQRSQWLVTDSREDKPGHDTVRLWNMQLDELVKLACRTAGRNLTEKEWQQYFYGQPYQKTCPELP
jgi:WD40 repeat protein